MSEGKLSAMPAVFAEMVAPAASRISGARAAAKFAAAAE